MLRGYLELLRPANVVTALADVLAGAAVAGAAGPRAFVCLLPATACLYAGGVVLNDVFDRDIDRVERPERPIPSGRVPTSRAAWLGATLLAAGIVAAAAANATAGLVALAIAAAVVLYDARGKRTPLGPVNMGACRGLNFVLGVAAVPAAVAVHWPLGLIGFTYIVAVTIVSRGEVLGGHRAASSLALALLVGVLAVLVALGTRPGQMSWLAIGLTAILAWRTIPAFWRAWRTLAPGAARQAVRAGVLSLVLVDAVISAAYADMIDCLAVLATAVLAWWLARLFAVT